MRKNISTTDRIIRVILFIVFVMLVVNNYEDPLIRVMAGVMAVYVMLTVIFEICAIYTLMKIATKPSKSDKPFY